MADSTTIARPYAKAIFNHALKTQQLSAWSECLHALAAVVLDPSALAFLNNPASRPEQHTELLMIGLPKKNKDLGDFPKNLIEILAHNKRLIILPQILSLFESMRAEQERTVLVDVFSFAKLSTEEEKKLIASLSKRLNREITLNISIDKNLLGGAIIRAGDLVIDGSVRGKINKLRALLVA